MRLFTVARRTARSPLPDVEGHWQVCTPEAVQGFPAVGFFYGRELHRALEVPIGLIDITWGGSSIEAWTALEDVEADPLLAAHAAWCRECLELSTYAGGVSGAMQAWEARRDAALSDTRGQESGWAEPGHEDSHWPGCPVPGTFDEVAGEMDGAVWYRREMEIPPHWVGRDLELHLGVIDDLDHTFWNGSLIGKTGTDTPEYYKYARIYTVPGTMVNAGGNLLAVRVFDEYLSGGFVSAASDLWVAPCGADETERLPLAGWWKIQVEQILPQRPWAQAEPQTQPEGIFHGMVAPLIPYGIRGVIWYQGENNIGYAGRYAAQFPRMIEAWRRRWQGEDFPFLFVQLANFSQRQENPAGSSWAELREAQKAGLRLPNTAMVTTIDVGDGDDLHPANKSAVGLRLASTALATVYGHEIPEYRGPVPERVAADEHNIRIHYRHAVGLRTVDGRAPQGFLVVQEDGRPEWASARIEESSIVLSTPARPKKVRYAWADNPDVNLVNQAGFPAEPFTWDLPAAWALQEHDVAKEP
jgi:sialate O-acetylesterase